jgi:hypothetical protein
MTCRVKWEPHGRPAMRWIYDRCSRPRSEAQRRVDRHVEALVGVVEAVDHVGGEQTTPRARRIAETARAAPHSTWERLPVPTVRRIAAAAASPTATAQVRSTGRSRPSPRRSRSPRPGPIHATDVVTGAGLELVLVLPAGAAPERASCCSAAPSHGGLERRAARSRAVAAHHRA